MDKTILAVSSTEFAVEHVANAIVGFAWAVAMGNDATARRNM